MEVALIDDVYVFARDTAPDLIDRFTRDPVEQVRFLANTTGPFNAFAVVEAADPGSLPDLLARTFGRPGEANAADPETAKPLVTGFAQLRRTKPFAKISFVRIDAEPGRAGDVLDATASLTGYNGSAIVAGDFDVLVEVGADSEQALYTQLLGEVHKLPGIRSSTTALVVGPFYYRGS
jgi:hypothetical protein